MAEALSTGPTAPFTWVIGNTIRRVAQATTNSRMGQAMKGISTKTKSRDTAARSGLMETNTMDSGKITACMDMASTLQQTSRDMMVSLKTI